VFDHIRARGIPALLVTHDLADVADPQPTDPTDGTAPASPMLTVPPKPCCALRYMALARGLVRIGVGANALSWSPALPSGMAAAGAIALQAVPAGLALLLVSRLLDGLDGAVARATQPTDAGGFLDITLDFLFYAAIPLGFALADPAANALPAAVLLASFIGTGSSFLAFAALAENGVSPTPRCPAKAFTFWVA
jgi:phosphatidylglycerophosphate synthase